MDYGKSIELFLVNGTADSLITAELSNWNGKAFKIPRIEVVDTNREDMSQAGVYFLFGKEKDEEEAVYIGESENIKERLIQHIRNSNDNEEFYWNTAVFFTGRDLNKAHIRYLENRLVKEARNSKRYEVLTKTTYNPVLKESQIASMEEFIENIKILINTLGFKVLEPLKQTRLDDNENYLFLKVGKKYAEGFITPEGFVVLKGAHINKKVNSSLPQKLKNLRNDLTEKDIIKEFQTQEDILFNSPTSAAEFILGCSVSGPKTWKNREGKSLKEIEKV